MRDKYVLDSSVWISMERGDAGILRVVEPMIQKNEVCLVDVIKAEVLRGALSAKGYRKLHHAFSFFTELGISWDRVASMAFKIARKGFMPPLIDIYIAAAVIENGKVLVSQDRHFRLIQKAVPLRLILLK